jgi:hypothetical protein
MLSIFFEREYLKHFSSSHAYWQMNGNSALQDRTSQNCVVKPFAATCTQTSFASRLASNSVMVLLTGGQLTNVNGAPDEAHKNVLNGTEYTPDVHHP